MPLERSRQLIGGVWRYVSADQSDNGGSQPGGSMVTADFLFTEVAVAKIYTATLDVEAGTVVEDVRGWLLASWQASTGWYGVVDSDGKYVDPANHTIGNDQGNYDPETAQNGQTTWTTFQSDGSLAPGLPAAQAPTLHNPGRYYADADTITITVDCTDSDSLGTTGRFLVRILYTTPVAAIPAT